SGSCVCSLVKTPESAVKQKPHFRYLVAILSPARSSLVETLRLKAIRTKAYGRLSGRSPNCNFSFTEHRRVPEGDKSEIKDRRFHTRKFLHASCIRMWRKCIRSLEVV